MNWVYELQNTQEEKELIKKLVELEKNNKREFTLRFKDRLSPAKTMYFLENSEKIPKQDGICNRDLNSYINGFCKTYDIECVVIKNLDEVKFLLEPEVFQIERYSCGRISSSHSCTCGIDNHNCTCCPKCEKI